jgi:hypothetical protein
MRASGYDYCNSISTDAISNFEFMQADLGRCVMQEPFANPAWEDATCCFRVWLQFEKEFDKGI